MIIVKLPVLGLGLGVDFTFAWDNNDNNNNNNNNNNDKNPHLNFPLLGKSEICYVDIIHKYKVNQGITVEQPQSLGQSQSNYNLSYRWWIWL